MFMKFTTYKYWLNEKFTEDSDPIEDMGIGIRHKIEEWINKIAKETESSLDQIYNNYLQKLKINNNGRIDAQYVNISWDMYNTLPSYIRFNHIKGDFHCCFDNIKTIKLNGPKIVDGEYFIYYTTGINKPKFTERAVKKICKVNTVRIIYVP
jgi:hypothetical protein